MSKMDIEFVKRLVIFATLMENGEGIISKSPGYIAEKYISIVKPELSEIYARGYLDDINQSKYDRWLKIWTKKVD